MPILNNDTLYVGSVGLRVSEVNSLIGEGLDTGLLCTSSRINKWSKWKPFRSAAIGFSTASDQLVAMKNVNMGFLPIPEADVSSGHITNPAWTYNIPRGIKNTSTNPTNSDEWYRLLDFAPLGSTAQSPGYCHNAVLPFAVEWQTFLYCDMANTVILFVDQQVNRGSSSWNAATCVSFLDCVDGSNNTQVDYGSYYFALLITDNSGGQNSNVLLSSGVTVDDLVSAQSKMITFQFCSYEAPESAQAGVILPEYTFAPNKTGHNFDIAWVLAPLSSSDTYITTNFPTMISLNLESGVNFNNLRLDYADTIYGLTGYITTSSPAFTSTGVTCQFSIQESGTYTLYHLSALKVYLDVSDCEWHIVSNGALANRQEVYIELGDADNSGPLVGVSSSGVHAFIVTTDVVPDPTQVDLTTAYTQYYNNNVGAMKAYVPASGERYFKAEITKQEVTKVCSLSSAPGAGNVLPDIYVWIRNDSVSSGDAVLDALGSAWSKYANGASSPSGMSVSLSTHELTF